MNEPDESAPIPVVVHLSGPDRGETLRLSGDGLRIGTSPEAEIRLPEGGTVADHHATLRRRGRTYALETEPGEAVFVDGEPVDRVALMSGDVLEIGPGGPVLRFRLYPPGSSALKSMAEAFSDCLDCARMAEGGPLRRAGLLLRGVPRELATRTTWRVRGMLTLLLISLLIGAGSLAWQNSRLEDRLAAERTRSIGLEELLEESGRRFLRPEDLQEARASIERRLGQTDERLSATATRLDSLAGESARTVVLAEAARSVIFVQGSFALVDDESGRVLRYIGLDEEGDPLRTPDGSIAVSLDGEGPPAEIVFSGTAFVVTESGLLLTNEHVARPWNHDRRTRFVQDRGLTPRLRRFLGYVPEMERPLRLEIVRASRDLDLAVLRVRGTRRLPPPLVLADERPARGQEVVILGYPAGIRGLMARADVAALEEIERSGRIDAWSVAERLASRGSITPLATRGIVGDVKDRVILYDAQTTTGGSGGPVLGPGGEVIAVNKAVLVGFGGANMGVPSQVADPLLEGVR